jgi:hypothetical protein
MNMHRLAGMVLAVSLIVTHQRSRGTEQVTRSSPGSHGTT